MMKSNVTYHSLGQANGLDVWVPSGVESYYLATPRIMHKNSQLMNFRMMVSLKFIWAYLTIPIFSML